MCGIAGYINPLGVTTEDIKLMTDTLSHRGPDDEGVVLCADNTVGLGHRRLSIIDLEGGHQPIANEDKTLWIVFNGEIYNYREIKRGLSNKYLFKTNSDTEVLLHLYAEVGEACLHYLRGMFAFAIIDVQKKRLFAARDHFGQKPFYYYHDGDTFAFASEIKALLALKPELRTLDAHALYEYLTLRIVTPPRSMFRQIRKLPPAHALMFGEGRACIKPYWQLSYEPKRDLSFNMAVDVLDKKIEEAVAYHLISDVPVGAYLSGGLDSSLVVAMMSRQLGANFQTFSGSVDYEQFDEAPYARIVAQRYRTDHHELSISPSLTQLMPEILWHLDEPSDPLSVCIYLISKLARKNIKVVLGGDGGDELFGGYDRYYGNVYVSYYALLPEKLRKNILGQLINRMPEGFWYRSFSHKLRWLHQISFFNCGERYGKSLGYFYFSDQYKQSLYTDKFQKQIGMFDPESNLATYYRSARAEHAIDRMLSVDCATRMPDHPNMILDRMSMAHGLEARSPFLDHQLAEFCAQLKTTFKVKRLQRRRLQRALARQLLPEALLKKSKQGFSSALTYMLKAEYTLLFRLFLKNASLVRDGYLQKHAINQLLREHLSAQKDHGNRLWLLCNAEMWYRMFIDGQNKETLDGYIQKHTGNCLEAS